MMVRIAKTSIKIHNKYPYTERLCKDYIISGEAVMDFEVSADAREIELEYRLMKKIRNEEGSLPLCESMAIFRKICLKMLEYNGFFLHSSVVAVDGQAYAFTAKAGTGKSTHTALWMNYFKKRAFMVNGDKPIFRVLDGHMYACGHPWSGKEGLHTNAEVPLRAVCFLERSDVNSIRKITDREMIERLFVQLLLPEEEQQMEQLFRLLEKMVKDIPCYVLGCNISEKAVITAYEGMTKIIL